MAYPVSFLPEFQPTTLPSLHFGLWTLDFGLWTLDLDMFRPCIDLHEGKVKQIVGGTLGADPDQVRTNFVSDRSAAWYAELYKRDGLRGGHVVMLGPGNETEARA